MEIVLAGDRIRQHRLPVAHDRCSGLVTTRFNPEDQGHGATPIMQENRLGNDALIVIVFADPVPNDVFAFKAADGPIVTSDSDRIDWFRSMNGLEA
jgi:hypothetical protein